MPKTKPTQIHKTKPAAETTKEDYRGPLYLLLYYSDAGGFCDEEIQMTAEQHAALKQHLEMMKAPKSYEARTKAADERAKVIVNLLGDISGHKLQQLETVALISRRTCCGIDPMSKFMESLIFQYAHSEANGIGMTVEDVESELETLRENMTEAISEAHFIADRYPRPNAQSSGKEA